MPSSTTDRSIPGVLFVAAGAFALARFAAIASSLDVDVTLRFLGPLVLAAALSALAIVETRSTTVRAGLFAAALGWVVFGVAVLLPAVAAPLGLIAELVVIVAMGVVAITVWRTGEYTRKVRIALVINAVVTTIYLLSALLGFYGSLAALILVIFAVSTAVVGYYLVTRR